MSDDDLLARTTEAVSRLQAENAALRQRAEAAEAEAEIYREMHRNAVVDQTRIEQLEAGLREIKEWKPPMVKSRIDGRKVSFGVEYGSNGERDYFRHVAEKALLAAPQPEGE